MRLGNRAAADTLTMPEENMPEEHLFTIRPAFHKVAVAYALAGLLTIVATILIAFVGGTFGKVGLAALFFFALPMYRHLQRNHTHYTLSTSRLELEQGIIAKSTQHLALRHINNVAVNQSVGERLLGVGNVLIDSAGAADKIALKGIRNPRDCADRILAQLQRWR